MGLSGVLEAIIGLVFIYFLVSVLCSRPWDRPTSRRVVSTRPSRRRRAGADAFSGKASSIS